MANGVRKERVPGSKRPYMLAVVAAIIVFILIAPVRVHGDNMAPTLRDGDVVIIVKSTYSASRPPEYGAFVAFRRSFALAETLFKYGKEADPENVKAQQDERRYRVGRVEGLPGDVMQVKDDALLRNGKEVRGGVGMPPPEAFAEAEVTKNEDGTTSIKYVGGAYEVTTDSYGIPHTMDGKTVEEGTRVDGDSVFILNDNPEDYLDSRDPDVVPLLKDIRGKVVFRIWPINKFGAV